MNAQAQNDQIGNVELEAEFEQEPVPASHRKSLGAISAVWFGFPMVLTCSVFGGVLAALLGFQLAMLAILAGNLLLFGYVGALSYLSGTLGLNFGLQAKRVFGRLGSLVAVGFLATVVTGWFAFQVGLTGETVNASFGWSTSTVTVLAGVLFLGITFIGIRALSVLGLVAAPLFLLTASIALVITARDGGLGQVWSYDGIGGTSAMSFGAGTTLVFATFADSGTMTADFTRWSRSGREAVIATFTAFPVANLVSFLVGAVLVSTGAILEPAVNGGNFLPILTDDRGSLLSMLALLFIFINLGSVCTHCLYNGAVGWSQMTGQRMRLLTVVLGSIGTLVALAGAWSHFLDWLNILGVFVPPIGAVIIADQLLLGRMRTEAPTRLIRPTAIAGYGLGALAAGLTHYHAPQLSEVVVGALVAAGSYLLIEAATRPSRRPIIAA